LIFELNISYNNSYNNDIIILLENFSVGVDIKPYERG